LKYTDPFDSQEDDPILDNPDPSFYRDKPYSHILTAKLPMNSIAPQQHPFPYYPDEIRGQLDTGAGVSCTNLKYVLHDYHPFTSQYPSPIRMTAAIDKSSKQTAFTIPEGI
jgi:hypothetical protein